jgi:diguanylate cyclase (GGDEF)-like protein
MSMGSTKFDRGHCRQDTIEAPAALLSDASISILGLDFESLFPRDVAPSNLAKEKETAGLIPQALSSEANEELARLLQDVRMKCDAALLGTGQSQPISELLMRAIRCAVKQYMLRREMGNLALRDQLTGLYNRRGFLALGERQLKLGHRSGREILLFFADVDGLKKINDELGHAEGDLALLCAGQVLEKTFRDSDVIARFGGDEFAVLALEVSGHSESTIRARLEQNLKELNARHSRYALSISLGAVRFDPTSSRSSTSIEQLMIRADEAMYEAKRRRSKLSLVGAGD